MGKRKYPLTKTGRPRKHGAWAFLRSGFCPPAKRYIETWADSTVCEYLNDLGGLENASTAQLLLLRQIRQLLIYQGIVDEWTAEHGLILADGKLQPAVSLFYMGAVNHIRQNILALGLKRQSKEMDLQTYIKQNYPEPDTSKPATASQDAPGATIGSDLDQQDGSNEHH